MQKLAPFTVHADAFLVELSAHLCHEVAWEVGFSLQLVFPVSIWAGISKLALSIHFKVSAQLSLFFRFVLLLENLTFVSVLEDSLLGSSGCFAVRWFCFLLEKERVWLICLLRIIITSSGGGSWWFKFGWLIRLGFQEPVILLVFLLSETSSETMITVIGKVVELQRVLWIKFIFWSVWICVAAQSSLFKWSSLIFGRSPT